MTMIHITLPDGTVNEHAAGITCGEVIRCTRKKHGCLAAKVDGQECDLSTTLDDNCSVEGILSESDEGMHILRHSAAHLLAQAVMALYPGALPTIGPAIDRGFYYDRDGTHYPGRLESHREENARNRSTEPDG